jgi:hypothetical protein
MELWKVSKNEFLRETYGATGKTTMVDGEQVILGRGKAEWHGIACVNIGTHAKAGKAIVW